MYSIHFNRLLKVNDSFILVFIVMIITPVHKIIENSGETSKRSLRDQNISSVKRKLIFIIAQIY